MKFVKRSLRKIFHNAGYGIVNIKVAQAESEKRRWAWLQAADFGTVLDIGANVGQFAGVIQKFLPEANLYSFEPLADCYDELVRKMESKKKFKAFNLALSDFDGEADFYMSASSASSSLLPMGKLHSDLYPHTSITSVCKVRTAKLDSLASQIVVQGNILVKLDVQGAEDRVIRGGAELIRQAYAILTEISYESLYERQSLFDEVYELLKMYGFEFRGSMYQEYRRDNGFPLFADALFINSKNDLRRVDVKRTPTFVGSK
jgi:FkbM family methyltransferase